MNFSKFFFGKKGLEMKVIIIFVILLVFLIMVALLYRSLAGDTEGLLSNLFNFL